MCLLKMNMYFNKSSPRFLLRNLGSSELVDLAQDTCIYPHCIHSVLGFMTVYHKPETRQLAFLLFVTACAEQ